MELPFKLSPLCVNMNLLKTNIIFRGCQSEDGEGNWTVFAYSLGYSVGCSAILIFEKQLTYCPKDT